MFGLAFESKRQHYYFAKEMENALKMSNMRIEQAPCAYLCPGVTD